MAKIAKTPPLPIDTSHDHSSKFLYKSNTIPIPPPLAVSDQIIIAFGVLVCLFNVLIFVAWCRHRRLSPMRTKQAHLIMVGLLASIFWYLGVLQSFNLIPQTGPILSQCRLWGVWFQITLGHLAIPTIIAYRLFRFHRILVLGHPDRGIRSILIAMTFFLPILLIGIISSIVPSSVMFNSPEMLDMSGARITAGKETKDQSNNSSIQDINDYESNSSSSDEDENWVLLCDMKEMYQLMIDVTGIALVMVVFGFWWILRDVRKTFNEFRETGIGGAILLIGLCTKMILNLLYVDETFWGRFLVCFIVLVAGNLYFWLLICRPLYKCVFHQKEYLAEFRHSLHGDSVVFVNANLIKLLEEESLSSSSSSSSIYTSTTTSSSMSSPPLANNSTMTSMASITTSGMTTSTSVLSFITMSSPSLSRSSMSISTSPSFHPLPPPPPPPSSSSSSSSSPVVLTSTTTTTASPSISSPPIPLSSSLLYPSCPPLYPSSSPHMIMKYQTPPPSIHKIIQGRSNRLSGSSLSNHQTTTQSQNQNSND